MEGYNTAVPAAAAAASGGKTLPVLRLLIVTKASVNCGWQPDDNHRTLIKEEL